MAKHRVMFDLGALNIVAGHRQRGGFGRARGKDDVRPFSPESTRHLTARLFQQRLGRTTFRMNGRRIADHVHRRDHRLSRLDP